MKTNIPLLESLELFETLQTALANCRSVDDCKQIAEQALEANAYYTRGKRDLSGRRFLEVKLRALRRIGEIVRQVDASGCDTQAARRRKIREALSDGALREMPDGMIDEAIELAAVPEDFFEAHVGDYASAVALTYLYRQAQLGERPTTPAERKGKAAHDRDIAM